MSIDTFPPPAVAWMTVWESATVMTVDGSAAVARRLRSAGHHVFALSPEDSTIQRLRSLDVTPVHAHPTAVPTEPFQFDVVLTHQNLHQVDPARTLAEAARVLRPGGCFAASYLVRDDSVPWVRRLAALLRHYDPVAMSGDFGQDSLVALEESRYFPEVEKRAFRIWQPMSLPDLQQLVTSQPLAARLDPDQRRRLGDEVADLYNAAARPGEQLRLPYQLLCHRGFVNHDELSARVEVPPEGLQITM